jgi:hypothetical protein
MRAGNAYALYDRIRFTGDEDQIAMSIKEKPLIDAVSRLGPLPAFLFSNPVFVGFFAMLMCPVFGAVFALFQVAGRGTVNALTLFEAARWGAIIGVIWGALIFIGIAVSAFHHQDEKRYRLLFVLGGALGVAFLVITDRLALEALRDWFSTAGPLV